MSTTDYSTKIREREWKGLKYKKTCKKQKRLLNRNDLKKIRLERKYLYKSVNKLSHAYTKPWKTLDNDPETLPSKIADGKIF